MSLSWVAGISYTHYIIHFTKVNVTLDEGCCWDSIDEIRKKKNKEGRKKKNARGGFAARRFSQHGTSVSWSFNPFLSQSTFVRVINGKACVTGESRQPDSTTFKVSMRRYTTIIVFRSRTKLFLYPSSIEYLCTQRQTFFNVFNAFFQRNLANIAKRLPFFTSDKFGLVRNVHNVDKATRFFSNSHASLIKAMKIRTIIHTLRQNGIRPPRRFATSCLFFFLRDEYEVPYFLSRSYESVRELSSINSIG